MLTAADKRPTPRNRINFFMVPCVYFFYPETAYRSLEEMDEIFQECHGLKGALDVVKVAKRKPRRYDKHGELLISYNETEIAHRRHAAGAARGSGGGGGVVGGGGGGGSAEKGDDSTSPSEERQEKVD